MAWFGANFTLMEAHENRRNRKFEVWRGKRKQEPINCQNKLAPQLWMSSWNVMMVITDNQFQHNFRWWKLKWFKKKGSWDLQYETCPWQTHEPCRSPSAEGRDTHEQQDPMAIHQSMWNIETNNTRRNQDRRISDSSIAREREALHSIDL